MLLEVTNFQSIARAALKIEGFTALVGRSNIGKSALIRAVKAALMGAPATSFVRHTPDCVRRTKKAKTCKCFATVHLQSENFDLLWEKGDAINRYTFNGQVYDKAERGTPEFLQPAYAPVKVGTEKELIQVADQFSPLFLLNQSGNVVADVLSDVAHLDQINEAMRLCEKDRREATALRKVRQQDVAALTLKLNSFEGLDEAVAQATALEERYTKLEWKKGQVQLLDGFCRSGAAINQKLSILSLVVAVTPPDPQPLAKACSALVWLGTHHEQVLSRVKGIKTLTAIGELKVPDMAPVRAVSDSFVRLDGWLDRLTSFRTWREKVKTLDAAVLPPLAPLGTLYAQHTKATDLCRRYNGLLRAMADIQAVQAQAERDLQAVTQEWADLGLCPTCEQPFHRGA